MRTIFWMGRAEILKTSYFRGVSVSSDMAKEPIKWLSAEMEEIASREQPQWKCSLLKFISKLLNVKEKYPYCWRYKGRKLEQSGEIYRYRVVDSDNVVLEYMEHINDED